MAAMTSAPTVQCLESARPKRGGRRSEAGPRHHNRHQGAEPISIERIYDAAWDTIHRRLLFEWLRASSSGRAQEQGGQLGLRRGRKKAVRGVHGKTRGHGKRARSNRVQPSGVLRATAVCEEGYCGYCRGVVPVMDVQVSGARRLVWWARVCGACNRPFSWGVSET